MKKVCIVIAVFVYFFLAKNVYGSDVVLNELQLDPSPEQVELYNKSDNPQDLSGWHIDDSGGSTYFTIDSGTTLFPHSCLVFSGDFNLNRTSEDTLRLFDSSKAPTDEGAQPVDSYAYSSTPGDNISYARSVDGEGEWKAASSTIGKHNESGDSCIHQEEVTPTPTPTLESTPTPTPTQNPTPLTYDGIYISEAQVNPESGQVEWIELFNANDFAVSLNNWYVDDKDNSGSSPKSFSQTMEPKSYVAIDFGSSMFNNDGDQVRLLDGAKNVKDSIEYNSSVKNKTIGRTTFPPNDVCFQDPTKGKSNTPCIASGSDGPTATPTPKSTKSSSTSQNKSALLGASSGQTSSNAKKPGGTTLKRALTKITPASISKKLGGAKGAVLGAALEKNDLKSKNPWLQSLSFASFSYALLAVVAIAFKAKKSLS